MQIVAYPPIPIIEDMAQVQFLSRFRLFAKTYLVLNSDN